MAPEETGAFAPNDNLDAAKGLDARIQSANRTANERVSELTKRKFPFFDWESFYQRWIQFYAELVDSWWSRALAHDRLLAYRQEWIAWRKVLAKFGIKEAARRPYDPSDDPPGSTGTGFGIGAGIAAAGVLIVGGYVLVRRL
jgi:hypothetical protein